MQLLHGNYNDKLLIDLLKYDKRILIMNTGSFQIYTVAKLSTNITYLHFAFKFTKNFNYIFPFDPHKCFVEYTGQAF